MEDKISFDELKIKIDENFKKIKGYSAEVMCQYANFDIAYVFTKELIKSLNISDFDSFLKDNFTSDEIKYIEDELSKNSLVNRFVQADDYAVLYALSYDEFFSLPKETIEKVARGENGSFEYLSEDVLHSLKEIINNPLDLLKPKLENNRQSYQIIETIDEESFEKIMETESYVGIENCKSVCKNVDYIKRLIKKGYINIIWNLNEDIFTDDLLKVIEEHIDFEKVSNCHVFSKKESLGYDKVFEIFARNIKSVNGFEWLFQCTPKNSLSSKKALILKLNGITSIFPKDFLSSVTLDDIKYAIEMGYKCSKKTVINSKDEVKLFIENGQPEIINYCNNNYVNEENYILAIKNGYDNFNRNFYISLTNEKFSELIEDGYYNGLILYFFNQEKNDVIVNLLRQKKGTKSYASYLNEIGLLDKFLNYNIVRNHSMFFENEDWTEIYKTKFNYYEAILRYLEFYENKEYDISNYIKSIDSIDFYFDSDGPKKSLYNELIFASEQEIKGIDFLRFINPLQIIVEDDYYKYIYSDSPKMLNFLELSKKTLLSKFVKSFEDIEILFDENGPTKIFYDMALTQEKIFKVLFSDEYKERYTSIYSSNKAILEYIKFNKKINICSSYIKTIDDIDKYFDSSGPKIILFDEALFDKIMFNKFFEHNNDYKMIYVNMPKKIQYIEFIKLNGFILDKYIKNVENINEYFDEFGLRKELYDLIIFDKFIFNRIMANDEKCKEIYKDSPAIIRYIEFNKANSFFTEGYIKNFKDLYEYFTDEGLKLDKVKTFFSDISKFPRKITEFIDKKNINDENLLTLLIQCEKINKSIIKNRFLEMMTSLENGTYKYEALTPDVISKVSSLYLKIENSNSIEMRNQCDKFIDLLINNIDDLDSINLKIGEIEKIFIENNLPYVAKIFNVFKVLYPNYANLDFDKSMMSPVLKQSKNNLTKDLIIFSDLLKCAIGSNNRSIKNYINDIELGDKIYQAIVDKKINYQDLTLEQTNILKSYVEHLKMLYKQTLKGKDETIELGDNLVENIDILSNLFDSKDDLKDRLVRMFFFFTHFEDIEKSEKIKLLTFDSLKTYVKNFTSQVDKRNREFAKRGLFTLEKDDFVKGIGGIDYFGYLLNNGFVAKEYLGSGAKSDSTPLDTDFSRILSDTVTDKSSPDYGEKHNIESAINETVTSRYGPIWVVLKNKNDRFSITRTNDGELSNKKELNKFEMFYSGALGNGEHFGLRTGFPSSEIDYIVTNTPYDDRIGLEIAMNGFYIPVVSMQGKLLFTPEMYDDLRTKMAGLSYFDENKYILNDTALSEEAKELSSEIINNEEDINQKRQVLYNLINQALVEFAKEEGEDTLKLKTYIDGNLSAGSVELLDTGSTGRKTNIPKDGDFDLMMRVDQELFIDDKKLQRLKRKIVECIDPLGAKSFVNGDIREYKASINVNGKPTDIEIDITFIVKSNNNGMDYPTEECVRDRLKSIKKQYPEQYEVVLANILLAKKLLKCKNNAAYKPARKDENQGGMGGIGIENWILQNGGSLYEAIKTFMDAAKKAKENFESIKDGNTESPVSTNEFIEFKKIYKIYDFGTNHLADKKKIYPHENFIENMNEVGYNKMKFIFEKYLQFYDQYGYTSVDGVLNMLDNKSILKDKYESEIDLKTDIALLLETSEDFLIESNLSSNEYMYEYCENDTTYLIKPGVNKNGIKVNPAMVESRNVASKLQKMLTPETSVDVEIIGSDLLKISKQEKIDAIPCSDIVLEHSNELLGEYVVDYLIGNFDVDSSDFIVDSSNHLRGIDKKQGLKYLMLDNNPQYLNFIYNSDENIYNSLFTRYINGEIDLDFTYLEGIINKLKHIDNYDYINLFRDYVELYDPKNKDTMLKVILERKEYLLNNIQEFINKLAEERENHIAYKK